MPPADQLTGWPTFRGTAGHLGRAAGGTGPDDALDQGWKRTVPAYRSVSISVAGGVVFVSSEDAGIVTFDGERGTRRAATLTNGASVSTEVVVSDGASYYGTSDGRLVGASAATGTMAWTMRSDPRQQHGKLVWRRIWATPTVEKKHVYASLPTAGGEENTGWVHCVRAVGMEGAGSQCTPSWPKTTSPPTGSPVVSDGMIYVGGGTKLYAFDATDGTMLWQADPTAENGSKVVGGGWSPAVAGSRVFVGGLSTAIVAFDATTGDRLWQYETGGPTGKQTGAVRPTYNPAATETEVFVGSSNETFYAFDAEDGSVRWTFAPDDRVVYWSMPAVDAETVYVAAHGALVSDGDVFDRDIHDARLYALDRKTGEVRSAVSGDGRVTHPVIGDGRLYAAFGGSVLAYQ